MEELTRAFKPLIRASAIAIFEMKGLSNSPSEMSVRSIIASAFKFARTFSALVSFPAPRALEARAGIESEKALKVVAFSKASAAFQEAVSPRLSLFPPEFESFQEN